MLKFYLKFGFHCKIRELASYMYPLKSQYIKQYNLILESSSGIYNL